VVTHIVDGPTHVSVSGVSGYVGTALTRALVTDGGYAVLGLRHSACSLTPLVGLHEISGNLLAPETLEDWPSKGSTVVHLAYMWLATPGDNARAAEHLVEACARKGIVRLVHVSTAAVVGRASSPWIDERTPCRPVTEYGQTKLHIEDVLREGARRHGFDLVVLRPTSVFGPGGAPLRKLVDDLRLAPWIGNYLKRCLFGRRAMNLVQVENVVAALCFLIAYQGRFDGATFILSEDDEPENNFANVEAVIRTGLGLADYPVPLIPLPPQLLSLALWTRRRNIVNPACRFRSALIESFGFTRTRRFADGLKDYLDWYKRDVMRSSAYSGPSV